MVIGSLAPDYEYFFRLRHQDRVGHTFPGALLFTLPIALAALALFHHVVKRPIVSVLPRGLRARLDPCARAPFRWWPLDRFLLIVGSVAAGILTHLAWDSFTHADSWLAEHWVHMKTPLLYVDLVAITIEKLAQYGSTLLGIAIVVGYIFVWYRKARADLLQPAPAASGSSIVLLVLAFTFATAIGSGFGIHLAGHTKGLHWMRRFVSGLVIIGWDTLMLESLLFSFYWWIAKRETPAPAEMPGEPSTRGAANRL